MFAYLRRSFLEDFQNYICVCKYLTVKLMGEMRLCEEAISNTSAFVSLFIFRIHTFHLITSEIKSFIIMKLLPNSKLICGQQ